MVADALGCPDVDDKAAAVPIPGPRNSSSVVVELDPHKCGTVGCTVWCKDRQLHLWCPSISGSRWEVGSPAPMRVVDLLKYRSALPVRWDNFVLWNSFAARTAAEVGRGVLVEVLPLALGLKSTQKI